MEERVSDLVDWLASLGPSVSDLVLFGDFNLCPLDVRESCWQGNIQNTPSSTFDLSQIVQYPTHGNRLIDHCFLGDFLLFSKYGLAPTLERK